MWRRSIHRQLPRPFYRFGNLPKGGEFAGYVPGQGGRWTIHTIYLACKGRASDRWRSPAASFFVVRHTLRLATSNNRDRFSCAIIQANAGGVHPPSLQQPLCRAEFNTGDDLAVDRAGNLTGDAQGRHSRCTGRQDIPRRLSSTLFGYSRTGRTNGVAMEFSSSSSWLSFSAIAAVPSFQQSISGPNIVIATHQSSNLHLGHPIAFSSSGPSSSD